MYTLCYTAEELKCWIEEHIHFPFLNILLSKNKGMPMLHLMLRIHNSDTKPEYPALWRHRWYIFEKNIIILYPAVFTTSIPFYFPHFLSCIYCGRKHPCLTCSQNWIKNGCADIMHSRNMNYVFCVSLNMWMYLSHCIRFFVFPSNRSYITCYCLIFENILIYRIEINIHFYTPLTRYINNTLASIQQTTNGDNQ